MRKTLVLILLAIAVGFSAVPANSYTLSGDISGGVFLGGITYIYAVSTEFTGTVPAFYIGMALLGNGYYAVLGVPEGDYIMFAYQDRDYNLIPSANDYYGFYGDTLPEILTVTGNTEDLDIEIAELPFTLITGSISYGGANTGLTYVQAAADPMFTDIAYFSFILDTAGTGDYMMFADSGLYYVRTFMDLDFSFTLSAGDPVGYYGYPNPPQIVDVTGGSAQNIDMTLYDAPNLTVSAQPMVPQIVIPAQGGTFNYVLTITNNGAAAVFDAWTEAVMPGGTVYGPILQRDMNMAAGGQLTRQMNQSVPGSAPAGDYIYAVKTGYYPFYIAAEDEFTFVKNAAMDALAPSEDNWNLSGWDGQNVSEITIPVRCELYPAYPNPFNGSAEIVFSLNQTVQVEIGIYNIQGRMVEQYKGSFSAGDNRLQLNLTSQPSGIYFVNLQAGQASRTEKIVLQK